jgi:hypothetical protein
MSYAPSVIKSIQQGTITFTGTNITSGTATITSVDTTKAMCLTTGGSQSGTSWLSSKVILTNATTVTASTSNDNGAARTYTTGYIVVEFY